MNLRYRVLLVAGLIAASLFALYPRQVVERVRGPNGFVYDTVQRVPLKVGIKLSQPDLHGMACPGRVILEVLLEGAIQRADLADGGVLILVSGQ